VVTDVTTDIVITKEETFGPVAPLYRFKTDDQAIRMANDTELGLAAYFYSRDIGRIWRAAEAREYGIVGYRLLGCGASENSRNRMVSSPLRDGCCGLHRRGIFVNAII
jgi:acyl-CoA reductase-like NAD-dependent aldehyde dehydrogenase